MPPHPPSLWPSPDPRTTSGAPPVAGRRRRDRRRRASARITVGVIRVSAGMVANASQLSPVNPFTVKGTAHAVFPADPWRAGTAQPARDGTADPPPLRPGGDPRSVG